jgi:DNA polymerase III epsilon subunit-like protein
MSYIVFDTETSGLMDFKRPADAPGQPRVCEFAGIKVDASGIIEGVFHRFVKPDGWEITDEAADINGLTTDFLREQGVPIEEVLDWYSDNILAGRSVVAFGAQFDCKMMRSELRLADRDDLFERTPNICLMRSARPFAKQIGRELIKAGGNNKGWPKLTDLCAFLEVTPVGDTHNALDDAHTTAACFHKMLSLGFNPEPEVHHAKNYEEIKSNV